METVSLTHQQKQDLIRTADDFVKCYKVQIFKPTLVSTAKAPHKILAYYEIEKTHYQQQNQNRRYKKRQN